MKNPGKQINPRLLQVFEAVARHQGYASAQNELSLSTSAISNHMSELEERLGFVLCRRGRAGFALTQKGEQFLQYSRRLLMELDQFTQQTEHLKEDRGGVFRLGVLDAMSFDSDLALPHCISRFNEAFPSVHLQLLVRSPPELTAALQENRIDMAIGMFPVRMNNVVSVPLYREQHWLYCGDRHPLATQVHRGFDPVRIAQYGIVTRTYWDSADVRERGFRHSTATVESMEAQLLLLLSGRYLGYLPEHYAWPWVQQGRLRALLPAEFGFQAPFSAVFRRGRSSEPFIRAMRDILKTQVPRKSRSARR